MCRHEQHSGQSPYQVATPSLVRIRGSFCLLRLLKVFKPVSKPLGLTHSLPDTLQLGPWDVDRTVTAGESPGTGGLHSSELTCFHIARAAVV